MSGIDLPTAFLLCFIVIMLITLVILAFTLSEVENNPGNTTGNSTAINDVGYVGGIAGIAIVIVVLLTIGGIRHFSKNPCPKPCDDGNLQNVEMRSRTRANVETDKELLHSIAPVVHGDRSGVHVSNPSVVSSSYPLAQPSPRVST